MLFQIFPYSTVWYLDHLEHHLRIILHPTTVFTRLSCMFLFTIHFFISSLIFSIFCKVHKQPQITLVLTAAVHFVNMLLSFHELCCFMTFSTIISSFFNIVIPVCKVTEMYKRAIFLLFLPFFGQTSSIVLKLSLAFCFFLCYNSQWSNWKRTFS